MKRPACKHWKAERCSLNLYGGKPSPGVCARCDKYEGPPRGAGDVLHSALKSTGIARVVKRVMGGDCGGCAKRRAAMNEGMPFKQD